MAKKHVVIFMLFFMMTGLLSAQRQFEKRWIYVSSNLYVDENVEKLEKLLNRAHKAGFNGVLFTDYKMFTWWKLDQADRWETNARKLRAITRDLDMEFAACVFPFGYAGALLFHDVNLASGVPIRKAPFKAADGFLTPVQTAQIVNGSFEEHRQDQALNYAFQDDPGKGSFIDTEIKKEGKVSLRFENVGDANPHGHGRICQTVDVQPFQQYRIKVWMKTENLNADQVNILVMADNQVLQHQYLQIEKDGRFQSINHARDVTTDWVQQHVAFNSLNHEKVNIYLGLWGGRTGKVWWDDLRIENTPTLNLLRRASLPLVLESPEGVVYEEGKDVEPIADPLLGQTLWPGSYDTRHEQSRIRLSKASRIKNGQSVLLSAYHTAIVHDGQVNCSLSEPKVFDLCRQQIQHVEKVLQPDVYFMSHDEIRVGGLEPDQTAKFKSSGDLLAYNIKTCYEIIRGQVGDRPVYVWSDMFDPHHNARSDYYLVNNTLAGSWQGLSSDIGIMKWGLGDQCRRGLQFFADRKHTQMIAAYYDSDVQTDYDSWQNACKGIDNIKGVMYTTWQNNYSNLEKFAATWWGSQEH